MFKIISTDIDHKNQAENELEFNLIEFQRWIYMQRLTMAETHIAQVISLGLDADGQNNFRSRAVLLNQGNISLNTYKRARAGLARIYQIDERTGKPSVYSIHPDIDPDEIKNASVEFLNISKKILTAAKEIADIEKHTNKVNKPEIVINNDTTNDKPGPKLDPASNWTRTQIGSMTRTQIGSMTRTQIGSTINDKLNGKNNGPASQYNLKEELGQNTTKDHIPAPNSHCEQRLTNSQNGICVDSSQNELNGSHNDLFNLCSRAAVVREAFAYYQQKAGEVSVSVPRALTGKRKRPLVQCIVACGGPDGWKAYVDRLMRSDLCLGKVPPKPGMKRFALNFEKHVLNEDFLCKTLEGNYDNRETGQHNGEVFMYNGMMLVD